MPHTIELTNEQAQAAREPLVEIGEIALPVKAAWRVSKQKRALQPVLEAIEDVRKQLVEQFGKRGDDGKLIQTQDGDVTRTEIADVPGFNAAFQELMRQTQTLDVLPLSLDLFRDCDVEVAPDVLFNLGPLFIESEPV